MFWNIVIGIASFVLQLILAPKPQNAKPAALEDFDAPIAEEGIEIPVLFGTDYMTAPNVTWYGDLKVEDIKGARRYGLFGPRQVIGHKYKLGMQMSLCNGPADSLYEIWAGDKLAWEGNSTGGRINIDEPDLFGGEDREGGIVGAIDVDMGAPTQARNTYLSSKLGATISAFRNVVTIVLRQVYIGTNTYIKPWQFKLMRIHLRSDGTQQWYDAKAAVPEAPGGASTGFVLDRSPTVANNFRGIDTLGHYAVLVDLANLIYVWDLRDGSRRTISTYVGDTFLGGYCLITSDMKLIIRRSVGGSAIFGSATYLCFIDLDSLALSQTIDLAPYVGSIALNAGFMAAEVDDGGTPTIYMRFGPYGEQVLLRKSGSFWGITSDGVAAGIVTDYDSNHYSMGLQYFYLPGNNAAVIDLIEWAGFAETNNVVPAGLGAALMNIVAYLPSTDEVIAFCNDGVARVWSPDLMTLNRSAGGFPTNLGQPSNWYAPRRIQIGASSVAVTVGYFSGTTVQDIYIVNIHTLTVESITPVYPTSTYVENDENYIAAIPNATHNGLFMVPQHNTNAAWWPLPSGPDMNPSHIIRECLTDATWGMGYNASDIDDDSFTAAADVFWNEYFGLTLKWATEAPIEDFVQMVQSHVDAYLYTSRTTGKFILKPIRLDYDVDDLQIVTEDDVVRWDDVSRRQPADSNTSVTVKYTDRKNRGREASHTFHNDAQIQQSGETITATRSYLGISRGDLAARVAQRDQRSLSAGIISGRIVCKRTVESLNPGDPFRIVSTRHNLDGEVMRVAEMKYDGGRTNLITIKFVQDVFSLGADALIDTSAGDWENPANPPAAVDPRLVWEMPYQELVEMIGLTDVTTILATNPDAGMLQASGARPSDDSLDATIYVDGTTEDIMSFAPTGLLASDVTALDTTITITDDTDLDLLTVGTLAGIVGATPGTTEIVLITAITGNDLTLSRGMLDSVPRIHAEGAALVAYDDYGMADYVPRTAGDTPDVQLVTRTPLGYLSLGAAPVDEVTLDSRAIRPLRPANVTVEGFTEGPVDANGLSNVTVDCVERNRLTETGAIAWTDATVTPEAGQTIIIEILDPTGITVITTYAGLTLGDMPFNVPVASFDGNTTGYIRVGAERDGYREWQAYTVAVLVSAEEVVLNGVDVELNGETVVL